MSEKLVKVKVTKPYKDMQKMLLFGKGEVHEVGEKRANELVSKGLVEIVKTKQAQAEK